MSQNSILLKEWAENELGFHAKNPVDWDGLCHGSLFNYWSHLISRVKSKKKTSHIRNNFRFQVHLGGTLADLEKDIKQDKERMERNNLIERKKALRAEIEEMKRNIKSSHENQSRQTKDIAKLIDVVKGHKRDFEECQRSKAYILDGFVKEMDEETRRVHEFRVNLHTYQKKILRWSSSEKQFATNEKSIESHGQKAINQGRSPTKKLFHSISHSDKHATKRFKSSSDEEREAYTQNLLESFRELGAEQILLEFTQSLMMKNKDLKQKVEKIDLREDALRIQSELEKNGLWIYSEANTGDEVRSIESLLHGFAGLHVSAGRETMKNATSIRDLECKNKEKLKEIRKELEYDPNMTDLHCRQILRKIELETTYIKLVAMIKKINEFIAHYQSLSRRHLYTDRKDEFSKKKYMLIAKQADDIREAQHDISNLVFRNRNFSTRLKGILAELADYRTTELKERSNLELSKLLKSVENQFTLRYDDFSALPIHVYSCTPYLKPSMKKMHSYQMSIKRLSNLEGRTSSKVVENILRELNLPSTIAPGKKLLSHIMNLKRENDHYTIWLKYNNSNESRNSLNKIEEMSTELRRLNDEAEKEDIPQALENMKYLEDIEDTLNKIVGEFEIWKKEPAQTMIADDPTFSYKDESLGKWQERYRVAFLEWQKHAKKKDSV